MAVSDKAIGSVADVKTYMGISTSSYDTLLEMLIDGVSFWMNSYTNRQIKNDSSPITEYHDGGPEDDDRKCIYPRKTPVASVTSVGYESGSSNYASPTFTDFSSATDYKVDTERGEIYFPGGIPAGRKNIKLVYTAGWSTPKTEVPDLYMAFLKLVSREFNKRKAQGKGSEAIGGTNINWESSLDHSSKMVLDSYKVIPV